MPELERSLPLQLDEGVPGVGVDPEEPLVEELSPVEEEPPPGKKPLVKAEAKSRIRELYKSSAVTASYQVNQWMVIRIVYIQSRTDTFFKGP